MTPATALGAVLVGALIPGYLYLVLTERVRRPRDQTPLAELLQVALVGAATTGTAVAVVLFLTPRTALRVADTWGSTPTAVTSTSLREAVTVSVLVVAVALCLAWLLARATHARAQQQFTPTVLQGALGRPRPKTDRWVGVQLEDGTYFDGRLSAYPLTDDRDKLVVALEKPIRRYADSKVTDLPFDRLVLTGGDITSISLLYQPQPSTTDTARPTRTKRLADAVARRAQRYADR